MDRRNAAKVMRRIVETPQMTGEAEAVARELTRKAAPSSSLGAEQVFEAWLTFPLGRGRLWHIASPSISASPSCPAAFSATSE